MTTPLYDLGSWTKQLSLNQIEEMAVTITLFIIDPLVSYTNLNLYIILQCIICFRNVVGYKNLGAAAWFTTSCDEKSPAYSYVQKLGYHTLVDVFGPLPCGDRCPQNKSEICLKLLRLRYRVTLVLENHSCNHTIPEMFYLALEWVYIVGFICNVLFLKIVTPTKCSDW